MSGPREATTYLQIAGRPPGPGPQWDQGHLATVVSSSVKKPSVVQPGCIVVKVRIRIPKEAWLPLSPEAIIEVPAELIQHPVLVEAVDAND